MSIPKILHYCWFGGSDFPKREQKCMKSWDVYLKDFTVKRWDETTFDVNAHPYVREAYEKKEYRFVSDYARLVALYNEGGLYLDTDCLVKKDFSDLMNTDDGFTGFGGDNKEIAAHALAFPSGHPFVAECLEDYNTGSFFAEYTINMRMTRLLKKHGFRDDGTEQTVCGVKIYPMTYFCPLSMVPDKVADCKSKDTYCIHVWSSKELKRERSFVVRFARRLGLNKLKRKLLKR